MIRYLSQKGSSHLRATPNNAASPNRRPRFAFFALREFVYFWRASPSLSAAVGELQR